jgi:hypothetical protein
VLGGAAGGAPGTVWKINGQTGEVTKFADIAGNGIANSGPGLGNIAYDARHRQFFVTDLDTGLIHRLDENGTEHGTYDHGLQGRPANGLEAIQDDGVQADITSPSFDAEDSGTWGLTPPERRVWGLAVFKNRLYYAVENGPQIWSIGIADDASFGSDARWELDIPNDPEALPVSDIAFQSSGRMIIAQRGGINSRYDYSRYHTPRKSRVLRFKLESPDDPNTPSLWGAEPEEYAIGFPGNYRNASGGIAIGYGYKEGTNGALGLGACEGTLWSSGDALRDNPVDSARLAEGGPLNVHGLQGNTLDLVRPGNEPPWSSYFVDFDGQFEDPQASGHVGDVEIPRRCGGKRASLMDLRIIKKAQPERCAPDTECAFGLEIMNVGSKPYTGPLVIHDIAHNGAQLVSHGPPEWTCNEAFPGTGSYQCTYPEVTLEPGQSFGLEMTFRTPGWWSRPVYDNCVDLVLPGAGVDERPYNNRSCDYVAFCSPGEPGCVPDLQLQKFGRYGACDFTGLCEFSVIISNVGPVPYTGPLNVSDFATTPGATMVDWSSKPEWNCAATGPDSFGCSTAAPVTLAPGDFREVIILVQGPALGPGFTHVRNCAYIDWDGAPPDANPYNEYDCAEISSLPPGHPDARATVDIQKDAQPTCSRTGVGNPWRCVYAVRIKNSGTAPLEGPIAFNDEVTAHPATLLGFFGGPGAWACAPGIGLSGPYTCTHPAIAGGLLPGNEIALLIGFQLPAGVPVPSWEQNCATISFDNDGDGANEDHQACALSLICDAGSGNCPQDLAVQKFPPAGPCPKGTSCPFSVQVQNLANANFPGPVTVTDIPDPGTGTVTTTTPGWNCVPAGGSFTCSNPAALPAGATASLSVDIPVEAGFLSNTLENCAEVAPGPGNDFPFNDKDCANAVVPQPLPADLAPFSETTCYRGQTCEVPGRIENRGQQVFKGTVGVNITLLPEIPNWRVTSDALRCASRTGKNYSCLGQDISIAPGKSADYVLTVDVPESFPHDEVQHIKKLYWPKDKDKDKNSKNDQHVSIIKIENPPETKEEKPTPPPPPPPPAGKADLAISKTALQPICNTNKPCVFTVTVSSTGTAAYSGGLTIRDTITPGSTRYVGRNWGGWNCTGNRGGVTCTKPNVTLKPGESDSITLHFSVPRYGSGTANNCATILPGVTAASRSGNLVRDVQAALAAQGYYKGAIDGKAGPQTAAAIREYQRLYNMPQTGRIDATLADRLLGAASGSSGGGDANPNNNRACASVSIQGEAPPPPPPQCSGGQYLDRSGQCVCPSSKPVWTGSRCISRPPQPCSGGRYRNPQGICVCPPDRPVWSGSQCNPAHEVCSGGRTYNEQLRQCVCPPSLPRWNGKFCSGIPGPQPCSGGRIRNNNGQCVCPPDKPNWSGSFCFVKEILCSGGRIRNNQGQCVCPVSLPIWNGKSCGGIIGPQCSGGRIKDRSGKCVCPSNKPIWSGSQCMPAHDPGCSGGQVYNERARKCVCPSSKPYWNGKFCTNITTNPGMPGHGGITPTPTPNCSGGRYYDQKSKSCKCPSSKPLYVGGQCRSLPGGIKIPFNKLQ